MPTCPSGHDSAAADYCDVCGIRMAGDGASAGGTSAGTSGASGAASGTATSSTAASVPAAPTGGTACPSCGEPLTARFCESCGYDRENPSLGTLVAEPAPGPAAGSAPASTSSPAPDGTAAAPGWVAVVGADHAYYERVMAELGADPGELPFPAYTPDRLVPLQGPHVRIGRRSASGGFVPEIDAARAPEDPAVSHEHAVLLPKPDGSWVLLDLGSTNGTTVGDAPDPIEPNVEVPLHEGDRVFVGAWTVVTVKKA